MATEKVLLGNIKGPKGDPFRYGDFTEEQKRDFAGHLVPMILDAANICYVSATLPASDVGKDGDICVISG